MSLFFTPARSLHADLPAGLRLAAVGAICLAAGASAQAKAAPAADHLEQARRKLDKRFREDLVKIVAVCEDPKFRDTLRTQGEVTRAWFIARQPKRQYLFLPPEPVKAPAATAHDLVKYWHQEFMARRRQYAQGLLALAEQWQQAGRPARALQLVYRALREDPQHEQARRILGIKPQAAAPRVRRPAAPHSTAGWRGGHYWRVETEHYVIDTSLSRAAGIELAATLEDLYVVWHQLFIAYRLPEGRLRALFQGGGSLPGSTEKHRVVLFRDRREYLARLGGVPQIAKSVGLYVGERRTAFFYAENGRPPTELAFHEGGHQLFAELRADAQRGGMTRHWWVVEGAALYLESLTKHDGFYTVGGFESDRLQLARQRTLAPGQADFTVLEKLVALSTDDFKQSAKIRQLYGDSAAYTHFLMDGEGGRHRPALLNYLVEVYTGRPRPDALPRLAGQSFDELQQAYLRFLKVTDAELAALGLAQPKRLLLVRADITDAGLAHLTRTKRLEHLELPYTRVTDAGAVHLADLKSLTVLHLGATQMTDAALPHVARLKGLESLDLSGLPITDDGLQSLAGLTSLTELWLYGTKITDAGLAHLRNLRKLKVLEVGQTGVTPEGWSRLKQALPNVQRAE